MRYINSLPLGNNKNNAKTAEQEIITPKFVSRLIYLELGSLHTRLVSRLISASSYLQSR